ncbi:hypothetical protein LZ554_000238 [Drepanopeziza brunnea f. sp. 'monogermtubi']|nr:hypothetical protein LZ554_000238 [Drepanopeziza brunnea f. sp. 'monogermtubi']
MIILSQYIGPLLLAWSFLFSRAQGRIVIGYRTVNEEEARATNENNMPFRPSSYDSDDAIAKQLGHGYYLTNQPGGWPGSPRRKNWYCAVEGAVKPLREVSKIWVPKYYEQEIEFAKYQTTNLWAGNETLILDYIKSWLPDIDAKKALRFSYIHRFGMNLQMAIPTDMINDNALDFHAQCFETVDELMGHESETVDWGTTVDWGRWPGMTGYPGEPTGTYS